jgi:cold-inducible RNA-binding protein
MAVKLYVGGLAYSVTDQELEQFFAEQGKVVSATVIKDKFSGQSKGFGFVEMEDQTEGQNAIKNLNGKELNGRSVTVNEARPQEDRRPRSGGGGGGGGGGRSNFRRSY